MAMRCFECNVLVEAGASHDCPKVERFTNRCVECHTIKDVTMRGDVRSRQVALCDKCYKDPSACEKCLEGNDRRAGGIQHEGRELCSPCYFEIVVAKVKSMPA